MKRPIALLATLTLALALGACDTDDTDEAEEPPPEPLRILVTNDDGVDNEGDNTGVDALVEALRTLPDVEIEVVTPLEDRSGTGSRTSDGPHAAAESTTESGYAATVVDGFPADAVTWALDGGIDFTPDVVVSGINPGQNVGPVAPISGTVGAALTAAAAGVPSLAVSVGLTEPPYDYSVAVDLALEWVEDRRDDLVAGEVPAETYSVNVPSCPEVKDLVEVPVNTDYDILDVLPVECDSTLTDPTDDVEGFLNGYAVISLVTPFEDGSGP